MRILMLCPLMSSSSMITVYPMAKALSGRHDITLVGPLLGSPPFITDDSIRCEYIEPCLGRPQQLAMMLLKKKNRARLEMRDYDAVHAFKLLPHTAPEASRAKRLLKKKFVLSIDDHDSAASRNILKTAVLRRAERACRDADAITVSSTCLQRIYGGDVIYQVPNEGLFMKAGKDPAGVKKSLGVEGKAMILYAGTFYEHKGLDVLIKAVQSCGKEDVRLVLAGSGGIEKRLRSMAGDETIFTGRLPMERVAQLTAAADIYAIHTLDTEYSRAEIPGKIFEPMMLGRPIIASRVSDIPGILGDGSCGLLSKPGDPGSLAASITYMLDNPKEAERLGRNARKRYAERYDMKHFGRKINLIYGRLG